MADMKLLVIVIHTRLFLDGNNGQKVNLFLQKYLNRNYKNNILSSSLELEKEKQTAILTLSSRQH